MPKKTTKKKNRGPAKKARVSPEAVANLQYALDRLERQVEALTVRVAGLESPAAPPQTPETPETPEIPETTPETPPPPAAAGAAPSEGPQEAPMQPPWRPWHRSPPPEEPRP